jgi:homoserine kinase type II
VLAGFSALGSFHQALAGQARFGPSPGLVQRLSEIESLLLGGFDVLQQIVEAANEESPRRDALQWLELARRAAPPCARLLAQAVTVGCRLQPCLRDIRPDHLLFQGNRVTGLIDFGAMRYETVAADLARLLSEWVEDDRWARGEALAAYSSIRRLDDSEGSLIEAFDASAALLGGGHWIRWHFLEGRVFEGPDTVDRGIARGLERLRRRLAGTIH